MSVPGRSHFPRDGTGNCGAAGPTSAIRWQANPGLWLVPAQAWCAKARSTLAHWADRERPKNIAMVRTNAVTRRPFLVAALTLIDTQARVVLCAWTKPGAGLFRRRGVRVYSDDDPMRAGKSANMTRKAPFSGVSGPGIQGFPTAFSATMATKPGWYQRTVCSGPAQKGTIIPPGPD